jgi:hypothetical protein
MKFYILAILVSLTLCDELSLEDLVAQNLSGAVTNQLLNLFKNTTLPVKDQLLNSLQFPLDSLKNIDLSKPEIAAVVKNITETLNNFKDTQKVEYFYSLIDQLKTSEKFIAAEVKDKYASAMKILNMLAEYVRTTNTDITKPFVRSKDDDFGVSTGTPTTTLVCAASQCVKDGKCVDKSLCEEGWFSWWFFGGFLTGILIVLVGVYVYNKKRVTNNQVEYMPQVNDRDY